MTVIALAPKALEMTMSGCTVASTCRLATHRRSVAEPGDHERRPPAVGIDEHGVPGEQVSASSAVDEVAGAAGGVPGGGDHLDAVGVDVAAVQYDVDGCVLTDPRQLGGGRVQPGTEVVGDPGQHRPGLVLMGQVLVVDSAELLDGGEVGVGGGAIEQHVGRRVAGRAVRRLVPVRFP